ncbi:MAG: hypothetical protein KTR21_08855 [Rhodobacteraceae bacterium]|nr:hypothetical protein [Paracoccaceae bacterium]
MASLSNPELIRNIWIECRPLRLAAALGVPALLLMISFTDNGDGAPVALFVTAHWIILAAVTFWGARKAADAVAGELRERTWDQQRLSGLGPGAMTIGKVFGAPSAVWALILFCVAVQIAVYPAIQPSNANFGPLALGYNITPAAIVAEIACAFLVFATAFFAGLLALNGQDRPRAFDATFFQLVGLGAGVALTIIVQAVAVEKAMPNMIEGRMVETLVMDWWGLSLEGSLALTLFAGVFGLWALYGGYHQMRRAFAMRTSALPWAAFLVWVAVFVAGWRPEVWAFSAAAAMAAACYAGALLEPHRLAEYRAWLRCWGTADLRALTAGPAWLYAWIATAALAPFALEILRETASDDDIRKLILSEIDISAAWLIASALMFLLRDMLICVWAGLRASDGRGLWAAVVMLVTLYVLLPALSTAVAGGTSGLQLLMPMGELSLFSAALQAAMAGGLILVEVTRPLRGPSEAAAA